MPGPWKWEGERPCELVVMKIGTLRGSRGLSPFLLFQALSVWPIRAIAHSGQVRELSHPQSGNREHLFAREQMLPRSEQVSAVETL